MTGVVALLALAACSAGSPTSGSNAEATSTAPQPPAACSLDTTALQSATGVAWAADAATASDTRCVYDPVDGPAEGTRFVTVTVAPRDTADPTAQLDELGELCDTGSRTAVTAADGGFVCLFQGRTVFAAVVRGQQVTTITASGAPVGTTVDALATAFGQQLSRS